MTEIISPQQVYDFFFNKMHSAIVSNDGCVQVGNFRVKGLQTLTWREIWIVDNEPIFGVRLSYFPREYLWINNKPEQATLVKLKLMIK